MEKTKYGINIGRSEALALFVLGLLVKRGMKEGPVFQGKTTSERIAENAPKLEALEEMVLYVRNSGMVSWDRHFNFKGDKILDARTQMDKVLELLEGPTVIKVNLNDTYTAEVSRDRKTVTVGCQTFDAERIKELYRAITEE